MAFILDNGAYTAKAGFATDNPMIIPNCIMKAKSERRRPFVGNQIDDCRDASGLFYMLPFQKGYLVNWDIQKTVWDFLFSKDCCNVNLSEMPLIVTEPLFNFGPIQETMTEIFFEEYECQSLLLINSPTLSYMNYKNTHSECKTCIIVDSGYSFTYIVPYVNGVKFKDGIRRIDVGGKLLTNHLKEIISYRQLHVMDETYVINQVKEDSCFVSQDFYKDMKIAQISLEYNSIIKDYVLPDYTSLRRGFLRNPQSQGEQQTLRLNNERFVVPEILFNPSDVGIRQMGIPEAIMNSVKSCEEEHWPHLLANIVLTGGNTKFPGFKERLYNNLRSLAPDELLINVTLPNKPETYAWEGGKILTNDSALNFMLLTREEYEENGPNMLIERFSV
ncbi:actin-related protein 6 isoform X2 [Chelonus insularis]|uniref:actin-related protein 6 isoform X2 n=1 Tax=Chelonus insularis TaxID=460826 RepID=UPI00158E7F51|nr:actin-related protein 6 isoform X2 [Chelonus insularis]